MSETADTTVDPEVLEPVDQRFNWRGGPKPAVIHVINYPDGLNPADLLHQAETEPAKPRHGGASDFVEVVEALRNRGFTWKEVGEWFTSKGSTMSLSSLQSAHHKWSSK